MLSLALAPVVQSKSSSSGGSGGSHEKKIYEGTCSVMKNFANAQYTVEVEFGTPSQKLKMIPDSGSSDLVVPSAKCTADDGCGGALHRPLLTRATK